MRTSAGLEGYKRNLGDELETVKVSPHAPILTYPHVSSRMLMYARRRVYVSVRQHTYDKV